MRMNKFLVLPMAFMLITLGGCGEKTSTTKEPSKAVSSESIVDKLDVKFSTSPQTPKVNEPTTISVDVNENGKSSKDAKVKFTIKFKGDPKTAAVVIEAKADTNGKYSAQFTAPKEGEYTVVSCVKGSKSHAMPEAKFQVSK